MLKNLRYIPFVFSLGLNGLWAAELNEGVCLNEEQAVKVFMEKFGVEPCELGKLNIFEKMRLEDLGYKIESAKLSFKETLTSPDWRIVKCILNGEKIVDFNSRIAQALEHDTHYTEQDIWEITLEELTGGKEIFTMVCEGALSDSRVISISISPNPSHLEAPKKL